jgi:hypothetical protein
VIAGGRDLVTPPAVAERIASLVPNAVLLTLSTMAHSALDFREPAVDEIPARPAVRLLWKAIDAAAIAEGALPAPAPRRRVRLA